MLWDALIAGSGPSAATAAHALARAGMHVLFVDRVDATRPKVGEVLPSAACRLLRSLHLQTPEASGVHAKIVGSLSSWETHELVASDALRNSEGPSWRLERGRFDEELRQSAVASGAVLLVGFVQQFYRQDELWQVRLDDGTHLSARWLIDATGRRSALSRAFGARRLRDSHLVAFYALAATAASGPQLQRTVIEAAPDGWWYAAYLPSGLAVAGLHVRPGQAARLRTPDAWQRAWRLTRHVCRLFPEMQEAHCLPPMEAGGARLDRFSGESWVACGDAALSFDPLSSQGIFTALYSGKLAAEILIKKGSEPSFAATAYGDELTRVWETYKARLKTFYDIALFKWDSRLIDWPS
jgi:flavin-dependent dehydrogenase